jgi:hypothetical protein
MDIGIDMGETKKGLDMTEKMDLMRDCHTLIFSLSLSLFLSLSLDLIFGELPPLYSE